MGCRAAFHEVGIRENSVFAVAVLVLILDGVDDNHVEKVKDRAVNRLLNAGAAELLHHGAYRLKTGFLRRRKFFGRIYREVAVACDIVDESRFRGFLKREFTCGACELNVLLL